MFRPVPQPRPQKPTWRETAFLLGLALIPAVIALAVIAFFAIAIGGGIK